MTKQWTRWQDWGSVVLGVVAGLAVLFVDTSNVATWSLVVFGVLAVVIGAVAIPVATTAHRGMAGQH